MEFRFQLTKFEVEELIANCDNLRSVKYAPVRPYVFTEQGVATFDMLAKRQRGVKIEIFTPSNGDLAETDFEAFGRQYGNLTKSTCGICHDRFIVVDQKELYSIGASLKDAGRLTFAVSKMGEALIPALLDSLRKATTAQMGYGMKAAGPATKKGGGK